MTTKIYVPCDAASLSMGAEAVADAIRESGADVAVTRTGTRGPPRVLCECV